MAEPIDGSTDAVDQEIGRWSCRMCGGPCPEMYLHCKGCVSRRSISTVALLAGSFALAYWRFGLASVCNPLPLLGLPVGVLLIVAGVLIRVW